jgi:2-furoate---CoA ligase
MIVRRPAIGQREVVEEAELDEFCRTSGLAKFKRPRRYLFVRDIPKSPVGKLLRRKLVAGEYETESTPIRSPNNGTAA